MKNLRYGMSLAALLLAGACAEDDAKDGDGWDVSEEFTEESGESVDGTGDGVDGTGGGGSGGGTDDGHFGTDEDDDDPPVVSGGGSSGSSGSGGGATGGSSSGGTPDTYVWTAVIYDTSTGDQACNGYDSGSDIFGVSLLHQDTGQEFAWGSVVADGIVFEGNEYPSTHMLDGTPPDLGADYCPWDFDDDTVATLGCGGWVAVEFLDSDGQPVPLDPNAGMSIIVYEYGPQCSTGTNDDTYSLNLCTDTDGIRNFDDSSCTIQLLVDARGEVEAPVGF